jgi:hypothetical protein
MELALNEARKAQSLGGADRLRDRPRWRVIASASNRTLGLRSTAHAEMLAIRAPPARHLSGSRNATFCHAEPCGVRGRDFVRAHPRPHYGAPDPERRRRQRVRFVRRRPATTGLRSGGISEAASATLLRGFFEARR